MHKISISIPSYCYTKGVDLDNSGNANRTAKLCKVDSIGILALKSLSCCAILDSTGIA